MYILDNKEEVNLIADGLRDQMDRVTKLAKEDYSGNALEIKALLSSTANAIPLVSEYFEEHYTLTGTLQDTLIAIGGEDYANVAAMVESTTRMGDTIMEIIEEALATLKVLQTEGENDE